MVLPPEMVIALLGVVVVMLLSILLAAYYRWRFDMTLRELAEERQKKAPNIATQRAVLRGQLAEQVAPLLPGFPYNPSEFRPLGQPIDFIVFEGLSDARDGGGVRRVILGDIKSGNARLSPHQEAIKRAIEEGRVAWETIRIDEQFNIRGGRSR